MLLLSSYNLFFTFDKSLNNYFIKLLGIEFTMEEPINIKWNLHFKKEESFQSDYLKVYVIINYLLRHHSTAEQL